MLLFFLDEPEKHILRFAQDDSRWLQVWAEALRYWPRTTVMLAKPSAREGGTSLRAMACITRRGTRRPPSSRRARFRATQVASGTSKKIARTCAPCRRACTRSARRSSRFSRRTGRTPASCASCPAANATPSKVWVSGFKEDGGTFDLSTMDWGGVPAPTAGTGFEQLTIAQRAVVLKNLGYAVNQQEVYVKANGTIKGGFVEGASGDYNTTTFDWGSVLPAAAGSAWKDLTLDQQDRVLAHLRHDAAHAVCACAGSARPCRPAHARARPSRHRPGPRPPRSPARLYRCSGGISSCARGR